MSHCAGDTMTLFISPAPGNSSSIIYSIPGLVREYRGVEEQWDYKKNMQTETTYTETQIKSSYLFFDDDAL